MVLNVTSVCRLCADGDVCTCDGDGLRGNTPEGVGLADGSLGVIREGDENVSGNGSKQNGNGDLGDGRGLYGRRRGQGGGAGGDSGGMGDGDGSARWGQAGGDGGWSSGGGRVKVCAEHRK